MTTPEQYYTLSGSITAPGEGAALFDHLPADVSQLCRIVQGLLIHIFWAERYGVQLSPARREEVQLRYVARQLERLLELDPRPLSQARPPETRQTIPV